MSVDQIWLNTTIWADVLCGNGCTDDWRTDKPILIAHNNTTLLLIKLFTKVKLIDRKRILQLNASLEMFFVKNT